MHPIQTGNVILILIGFALIASGPFIITRTVRGMLRIRKEDPKASLHWVNNGINILIAVLFFLAGILFVVNNLRGNPLA